MYNITKNSYCEKCKGACWNKENNSKTQHAAYNMFGIIPNNCVNGEDGAIHCPYSKN